MKCIICGKEEVFLDYLCLDHYLEKNPIFKKIPKNIRINQCTETKTYFKENLSDNSINSLITKILKNEIRYDKRKFTLLKINSRIEKDELYVELIGYIDNMDIIFPFTFKFEIRESLLPELARRHSNYFEGTLQIRYKERTIHEIKELLKFVQEFVILHKSNIVSTSRIKTGIDFLISDKNVIKEVAYELKNKYGGEIKSSAKLFTRNKQTSKEVYRVTYLIKLPEFKIGDLVKTQSKLILIKEIKSFEIWGVNVLTHKRTILNYQKTEFDIINKKDIKNSTISKIHPRLEGVDPDDFQSKKLENPIDNLQIGQNIKVSKINNKLFLIKY